MTWTEEQRQAALAEAIRSAEEGRAPEFDLAAVRANGAPPAEPRPRSTSEAEEEDDILSLLDLDGAQLRQCEAFEFPGTGKKVYVFPLSGADARDLSRWSGWVALDLREDDDEQAKEGKLKAAFIEIVALHVVACCYRDRRRLHRVFKRADVPILLKQVPAEVLLRVKQISEGLAGAQDKRQEALQAFFASMQDCTERLLGALDTWADCPPGLKEQVRELQLLAQQSA